MNEHEVVEHIIGVVFTQYSMQAGLHKFKKEGENSLQQELKQLHDMEVFIPIPEDNLTNSQVKGRVCADGRNQREEFTKNEAHS